MGAARKLVGDDSGLISEICELIEARTGVQLGQKQFSMAESRIRRRISDLKLADIEEYRKHLERNREEETEALVSLLTTHHTYFFREFSQFELLERELPRLAALAKERKEPLQVWSAACSRGQEVYSLAMHLRAHLKDHDFRIHGTDVDPESVRIASNGVFMRDEIKEVPLSYLADHWARGTGEIAAFVKAKKSLREKCEFAVGNLMTLSGSPARKFDVIFCRNVFIYFTPEQVKTVTQELLNRLNPGGLLVIGLSESLHGMGLPTRNVGPSVYAHKADVAPKVSTPARPETARALRVVCIDDSPTVLALLKKILGGEFGFEVAGTAGNGDEGAEMVKRLKPDLVTLDVHMPVCGGIDYLKKHHGPSMPPVVMVTSVSRDDQQLAQGAMALGASDYVEKPALNNLRERGEELRTKLKAAFVAKRGASPSKLDASFAKVQTTGKAKGKARVLACSEADLPRLMPYLREIVGSGIPTSLAIDVSPETLRSLAERLAKETGLKVETVAQAPGATAPGTLRVGSPAEVRAMVSAGSFRKVSVLCFGRPATYLGSLTGSAKAQFLFEDSFPVANPPAPGASVDTLPATSFLYTSDRFFGEGEDA